jgi:type 1 glutamine amidotransferase
MHKKFKLLFLAFLVATVSLTALSKIRPPAFMAIVILSRASDHAKMMTSAGPFLQEIAHDNNFKVDITDDTSLLNDVNLAKYQVLIQLQQAPFDMSAEQQAAVQKFIVQGKGWVGIHAAGLTGRDFVSPDVTYWQWFQDFMGGVVYSPHPAFQKGTVIVEDRKHPITRNLPEKFEVADEWYEFDKSPRPRVHVLARADESTYKQNKPMGDHPIIWTNPEYKRMIYIGIGHDAALCRDQHYKVLVRDAILWAASK